MARPSDLSRSLVVRDEGQSAAGSKVQSPLKCGKRRQERVSEAVNGAGLVGYEIATSREEDLKLGQLPLVGSELLKLGPHASLVGDDVGVVGVGLGLSAVGIARAVHG